MILPLLSWWWIPNNYYCSVITYMYVYNVHTHPYPLTHTSPPPPHAYTHMYTDSLRQKRMCACACACASVHVHVVIPYMYMWQHLMWSTWLSVLCFGRIGWAAGVPNLASAAPYCLQVHSYNLSHHVIKLPTLRLYNTHRRLLHS